VVEVLKIYQIYLHQITPEAIIRMGIFLGCEEPGTGAKREMLLQHA
jgi:hypothetical protein